MARGRLAVLAGLAVALAACSSGGYQPADPAGVSHCVAAWVKIHHDGVTARVVTAAAAGDQAAQQLEVAYLGDIRKGAACALLSHADDAYATSQINAQTGDHYTPGH